MLFWLWRSCFTFILSTRQGGGPAWVGTLLVPDATGLDFRGAREAESWCKTRSCAQDTPPWATNLSPCPRGARSLPCAGASLQEPRGIRQPSARPAYLFTSLALQWRLTEVSTLWFILSVIVRLYPAIWHSDLLGVYYPLLIRLLLGNSETQSSARVLSLFFRRATFKTWCRLNF